MASHLLPLTLSVTVVIDVRHAYIITLPALFINPSDYLTVTDKMTYNRKLQNTLDLFRLDTQIFCQEKLQSVHRFP